MSEHPIEGLMDVTLEKIKSMVDSTSTVQTLLQKGLIEEAGRLDLPGRPISFRTTDAFLRSFGLESLAQLPPLHSDDYMLEPEMQAAAPQADGAQE